MGLLYEYNDIILNNQDAWKYPLSVEFFNIKSYYKNLAVPLQPIKNVIYQLSVH